MLKLHSDPLSRREQGWGLHQPNPMFLARTIKMSKPNVNGRLIGPEISGGLDAIGCLGRVAKESVSGNGLEKHFRRSLQSTAKGAYSRLSFQSVSPLLSLRGMSFLHEL